MAFISTRSHAQETSRVTAEFSKIKTADDRKNNSRTRVGSNYGLKKLESNVLERIVVFDVCVGLRYFFSSAEVQSNSIRRSASEKIA